MKKGQTYPGDFKKKVIEDVRKNRLSYSEAKRKYGILGAHTIQKWERIYLEEGPEALYKERRGTKSKGRKPAMDKKVEQDLIAENQRLRAEIDYIKKLNALVSERVKRERKRKS